MSTQQKPRARRRVLEGTVVSDKMNKTRIVVVKRLTRHPKYEKRVRHALKVACHDANNQSHNGDIVEIVETRPLSRTKRWRITRVIRTAEPLETAKT